MTLGGVPGRVRCKNPPWCIIYEKKPNPKDGLAGSMSLCKDCLQVFFHQEGSTKVRVEQIYVANKHKTRPKVRALDRSRRSRSRQPR